MTDVSLVGSLYASSIVDTVREPLLLLSGDLHVVSANTSFCQTFQVTQEQLADRLLYEIGDGEWNIPALRRLLDEVLPAKSEMRDFEVEHRSQRFGFKTMLLNARQLNHPDGGVRLILLAFEDVTEQRRLAARLDRTMAELERSNRELESFASIASHDLQEPLRKILAFGELLETACEGQLPGKGRDYLARMTLAAARMQTLIVDLLALARVTIAGEPWRLVDLGTIVKDVLGDLEELVARTEGRVDVDPLPTLECDPTQMRQLFQNLIGNALKFRGDKAPIIRISAVEERGVWVIAVADNGIGFDLQDAERIFQPFERLHARDAFDGTGIGLALCRRIVERHDGTVSAEGEPGAGARFVIRLPAYQKALL